MENTIAQPNKSHNMSIFEFKQGLAALSWENNQINSVFWQFHRHWFGSCRGGGNVLLCHFPLFTSKHVKVVNTTADVMKQTVEKVGRRIFTLMNEHLEVHGFLYSVRFYFVKVATKKTSSLVSQSLVCQENLWNQTILGFSLFSQHRNTQRPLQQSSTWRSALPSPPCCQRVHSCSSSSSSWSSSMASIWVLEHTSLIGAESSASTTSSLDISLFFCRRSRNQKWNLIMLQTTEWQCQELQLRPLLC